MSRNSDSTYPGVRIASIVLVKPDPELLEALESVLNDMDEALLVKNADLSDLATVVAKWRPMALVVRADVLAFDPTEFQALARDVGAEVVTYEPDTVAVDVAAFLLPDLQAAHLVWTARERTRP